MTAVILLAVLLSIARLMIPLIVNYQTDIEHYVSRYLGTPVKIGKIEASWHYFEPVISLEQVEIYDQQQHGITAKIDQLTVELNLLHSVLNKKPQPKRFIVSGADISVINNGKIISLKGVKSKEKSHQGKAFHLKPVLQWFFDQHQIAFKNIAVNWYQPDGSMIQISDLNVILKNSDEKHTVEGDIFLNQQQQTRLHLQAQLKGDDNKLNHLRSKFHLSGRNVLTSQWIKYFHHKILPVSGGKVDFDIVARAYGLKLTKARLDFMLNHLSLDLQSTAKPLIKSSSGTFRWTRASSGQWILDSDNLNIITDKNIWPTLSFKLSQTEEATNSHHYSLFLNHFDIRALRYWLLQRQKTLSQYQQIIAHLQPQGSLHDIKLNVDMTDEKVGDFMLDAAYSAVGFKQWQHYPGLTGMSGQVHITPEAINLQIGTNKATVDLPWLFREKMRFSQLVVDMSARKYDNGWKVRLPTAKGVSGDMVFASKVALDFTQAHPEIELLAGFKTHAIESKDIHRLLPVGILDKPLVNWLDQAVKHVGESKITVVMRGPINDFPYDDKQGSFLVKANFKEATLAYTRGWPELTHLAGNLFFNERLMRADLQKGQINGADIDHANVSIPYMGHHKPVVVKVAGQAHGKMSQLENFLQTSPLKTYFSAQLSNLKLSGAMLLDLGLNIPIAHVIKDNVVKVHGNVTMNNASLVLPAWQFAADKINGKVHFTQEGISAEGLQASIFDHPSITNITQKHDKEKGQLTVIATKGQFSIPVLEKHYHMNLSHLFQGGSTFDSIVNINGKQGYQLSIASDLQGLKTQLPAPLAKTAAEKVATHFSIVFPNKKDIKTTFHYGDLMNGNMYLTMDKGELAFQNGTLHFGPSKAKAQKLPGLIVSGKLAATSLRQWMDTLKWLASQYQQRFDDNSNHQDLNILRRVDVEVGMLDVFGYQFHHLVMQLEKIQHDWSLLVSSPQVTGDLKFGKENGKNYVDLNLKRLYLEKTIEESQKNFQFDRSAIPAIYFYCDDLRYDHKIFNQVALRLLPSEDGLDIDKLSANSDYYSFYASGKWLFKQEVPQTIFYGQLLSSDINKAAKYLGFSSNVYSNKVDANFDFSWPGAPYAFSLDKLSGELTVNMGRGRIVGLSNGTNAKVGFARILTLLSLQSLPRRLQLNFSDLTKSGFSFDRMHSSLNMHQGYITTDNSYFNGAVARVDFKGKLDLKKKSYDLMAIIIPHVTSSLPVVAAIAGGPVAGVATWIVDKAIGPEVNKIAKYEYSITGSWDAPKVVAMK